jgi:hypothetical protein
MKEILKMKKLDLNKLKGIYSGSASEPESDLDFGPSNYEGKGKDTLSPGEEF